MVENIVIVGGVAGGASAAAKARRVDEHAEITVFERGPYVSFANCGLPYYIGGDITKRESLLVQSPEAFAQRFRVAAKVFHEVLRIDRQKKQVEVKNLKTGGVFTQPYDKLILATGAGAIIPPLPGITAKNIFIVKTVPDSDAIRAFIDAHHPRRAVIVGAGFIGLETAEALKRRGIDVTLVELQPQVLPPFDPDMAVFVQQHLEQEGIGVIVGDGLKAFIGADNATAIELNSGKQVPLDFAILSIGVRPELKLAQDAEIAIGQSGGIVVDEHQQTSDPDIYAAGDAVEVTHLVTGKKTRLPLAGPANKQGRAAGANAAGEALAFSGAIGTAIVETLGITAAKTGLSEREAKSAAIPYYISLTHSADHATYYPGSSLLHIKLTVEQGTGRLLGAQIVGERGVDKRIDVLATAISARLKVVDLEQLDLAYAPQFSSAKDPVVMAGFVASNVLRHDVETITCQELDARLGKGEAIQVVDVRTPQEHAEGHLQNAQLIPVDELRERIAELDPGKETVVYCRVGLRGYLAARILSQHGFAHVKNLTGGLLMCSKIESPAAVPAAVGGNGSAVVSVDELQLAMADSKIVAIDVREPDEYGYERIERIANRPLSSLQRQAAEFKEAARVYVMCQTGMRSKDAARLLHQAGCRDVRVVEGGLGAWKKRGFPVKRAPGPIPIMRQVQIAAGSLVVIGIILRWYWLSAFVGAGLVFAGTTGTCTMAMILARMPWNKSAAKQTGTGGPAAPGCASPTSGCKP